jgi:chemotaxis receptor (MCP) glutamine deamidase CheD
VLGLEQYGIDTEDFAKAAQKKFSCAVGTIKVSSAPHVVSCLILWCCVVLCAICAVEVCFYLHTHVAHPQLEKIVAFAGGKQAERYTT